MKPTKKRPAKRAVRTGSMEYKLMKLRNRIDEAWHGEEHKTDKHWVDNLITDVRTQGWTTLSKEDMLKCNGLWRAYA
tara:strand:+ start:87 stop:317 length:231 start_codon:yes stop_codon:yes gene_type:complete